MSTVDRRNPPAAGEPRAFSFPDFEVREIDSGLQMFTVRSNHEGLTALRLLAPGGASYAPRGQAWLASMSAASLDEGAAGQSSTELARAVEKYGGGISSGADWDASEISLDILTEHIAAVLPVFIDVATQPDFPADDIDRIRKQRLAEIERRAADPGSIAGIAFSQTLYGDGIYGHSLLGTRADLESVDPAELLAFYRRTMRSAGTKVIAAGGADFDEIADRLGNALAGFVDQEPPARPAICAERPDGIQITLVDRPQAQQTEMRIGHPGPTRNEPGREARILLNAILGGKFTSRINLNLREEHGFTYGASSRFVDRRGPGPFLVGAAVETESAGQAVRETLKELHRIRDEPVEAEELEDARSYVLGVFPYTLQTLQGVANRLETLIVHDLPHDYYDGMNDRMRAVTKADIQAAAQKHIHPDQIHIVIVGPAAELEGQLEAIGPVTRMTPVT